MNHLNIKAAIMKAGTSQAAIAAYLNVTPTSVGRVVAGTLRSKRIEKEIEKIVGPGVFPPSRKRGRQKTCWTGKLEPALGDTAPATERRVAKGRSGAVRRAVKVGA